MSAVLQARESSARYVDAVAPQLVRDFQLLAEAPGGVARLRQLILSMAVRGRLVPQQSSDEPACDLIGRLVAVRAKRLGAGPGASALGTAVRDDDALPCELPSGWAWARLTDLGAFCGGKTPSKQIARYWSGSIPWITPKDMKRLRLADSEDHVSQAAVDDGLELIPRHSLLIVVRSGILRRTVPTAVNEVETTINQDLKALKLTAPEMSAYVQLLLRGFEQFILDTLTKVGTTVESIRFDDFATQPFPVPPFAEQARILARVDELMHLCDALEAKGRLEAEQHARLLATLLGTLTDSSTPEELAANWKRVADHFDLLLDRPEAVDALEQTILQLAVRGLLVPQDPSDEPATVLIEQIRAARDGQLADAPGRKVRAELPEVEEDERPFAPPPGWEWTRFGEVTQVSGGVTLGRRGAIASPVSRPYLRVANVQRWKLSLDSMKDIVIDEAELSRYQLAEGDLLITEGGDWDKVGRTAIWRSELPGCLHQNHVFKARGYTTTWNPCWAELYLNLDVARAYFAASAKQTTNLASINMTELRHCVFPLPPLNEQARIVARVTELRRLCADLRQRLAASQTTQSHLAEARVNEVA